MSCGGAHHPPGCWSLSTGAVLLAPRSQTPPACANFSSAWGSWSRVGQDMTSAISASTTATGTTPTIAASTRRTDPDSCLAPHRLYDIGAVCPAVARGTACRAVVGPNANPCIKQGEVLFSCPEGLALGTEPYLVAPDSVLCQACGVSAEVEDLDPRQGYFSGSIKWGQNMLRGSIDETMIDRYYVLVVDSCSVVLKVVGMLPKQPPMSSASWAQPSCCDPEAYSWTASFELPPNYQRFQVLAVKDDVPKFVVQGGVFTDPIVDLVSRAESARLAVVPAALRLLATAAAVAASVT